MMSRNSPFTVHRLPFTIGLPLLSGLLLVVSQPPFSMSFLAFAALVPLFFAVEGLTPRAAFLRGFLAGLASYLGLIYWVTVAMNRYGGIPLPLSLLILLLLALYLSCYTGVFAFLLRFVERRHGIPLYVTAPMAWIILEYLRGFLLTGFPWSLLAHSQHAFLPFIQIVSFTGSYFISFLIVAVNTVLYHLLSRKRIHWAYVASVGLLMIGSLLYGFTVMARPETPDHRVALVQGNVPQNLKWTAEAMSRSLEKYVAATETKGKGADLVVWPETALPFIFDGDGPVGRAMADLAARTGADIMFGAVSKGKDGGAYNSAFVTAKTGVVAGQYNKVHLVPFGEFTPLSSYIPFLESMSVAGSGFLRGASHGPVPTSLGPAGILICYEGMFPAETNETVRSGAGFLVNITNDAWFGTTSAPYQHLAAYVFRAIETDRYVVRAANTGVSAVINSKGEITNRTDIFVDAVLLGRFGVKQGQTFYVRFGDYFVILVCLAFICTIAAVTAFERSRRGSQKRAPVPPRTRRR